MTRVRVSIELPYLLLLPAGEYPTPKEPDGFWQDLSASYDLRNGIIHRGQIAHEDDAKLAIKVARKIVQIVASLPGQ